MSTVLVTGASGMLGGAVARALAARGDDVTVMQRGPSSTALRELRVDIADQTAVQSVVHGFDSVVHLAAKVSLTGDERDFAAVNIDGTRHLLQAARESGVGRFVHVSSPSVAHAGASIVGAEAQPADPARAHGHYARTKAVAELAALDADGDGLAVVAVRPHLVWGPGDEQLIGRIIRRARAGRLFLVHRGYALIDTTYVDNAVDAIVAALDRAPDPAVHGRAFVVTNGEPRTVRELLTRIAGAAGLPGPTRSVPLPLARAAGACVEAVWSIGRHADEPPMTRFLAEQLATAHWFDQRQTRAALHWQPQVSLDEGFALLAASFSA
jgi:nucleoside-diphosphate-sugar epimerase